MVPTTDSTDQPIGDFYDALAQDYDQMTSFETRLVSERPFVRLLVEKHSIASALDAGSGSGFHSVLLAQLGVRVTAVDLSNVMLGALARHAATKGLSVRVLQASFRDLPSRFHEVVDGVFCMGNALAHLLDSRELEAALTAFRKVIRPGGSLVLQILNYDRILAERQRIQSVREAGGATFVRFYDYHNDHLVFNVVKLEHREAGVEQHALAIPLKPWTSNELTHALVRAGFQEVELFGSIALEQFASASSKDLVIHTSAPS